MSIRNATPPQTRLVRRIRRSEWSNPHFVHAVYFVASMISAQMRVRPCQWPDFLIFLTNFAEELGANSIELECAAQLDALYAPDEMSEQGANTFDARLYEWCKRNLCRPPSSKRGYAPAKTRPWFLTTATVLMTAFPKVVRPKPVWRSPQFRRDWKLVRVAWLSEKERLPSR